MAQHNPGTEQYKIDDATGGNFRSDLNNLLKAIQSNNSGATAPVDAASALDVENYQWWYDTTNHQSSPHAWGCFQGHHKIE